MNWRLLVVTASMMAVTVCADAQKQTTAGVSPGVEGYPISKEIYGQFAEHLGSCIYGGLWVGKDSPIPNTQGYRNDVLQALRDIKVPVMRWPGG